MKKATTIIFVFLLILPIVSANTEADQLDSIIRQIKDSILLVQVKGKPCLTTALHLLRNRMDEMLGATAFLSHITNPVTWARQLLLRFPIDLAISIGEDLQQRIKEYTTKGGKIYFKEYKPGWVRNYVWGDECKDFNLIFIWLKEENVVKVIASGDCQCDSDLNDFYIQFDVYLKENEDAEPDASNRYLLKGFSNSGYNQEYFINPDDEANAVIKVNCCKRKGDRVNYPDPCEDDDNEIGYSLPGSVFTDPDEFLAALDTGKFIPTQEDREKFMRETLCSRIDIIRETIPDPIKETIPDPVNRTREEENPPTGPDPVRTREEENPPTGPDPVRTREEENPPTEPDPVRTPPILPPTPTTPKSCEEVCREKEWDTKQKDYTTYISNEINKYKCASRAIVSLPEKHIIGACTCYDPNEKPEIKIDSEVPVCKDTFCGDVPCGEEKHCEEPGTIYSADCRWEGWQKTNSGEFVPILEVY